MLWSLSENIRVAFSGLRSNKLRSFLTMIGITIGVFAVVVLVSIGQAVENYVRDQFEGIGANLLFVVPFNARGEFTPIVQRDVNAISDPFRVPDALNVMPQLGNTRTVTSEGVQIQSPIQGVLPNYTQIFNRQVVAGRFIDADDVDTAARVAVLGQGTVNQLFPDRLPLGETIRIGGVRFTIIGVLDQGNDLGPPGSQNNVILVPITTSQVRLSGERVLTGERPVSFIVVQARSSEVIEDTARQIRLTLRESRNISFRAEDNFQVLVSNDVLETFERITSLITIFLGVLASISLLVGGIGIMNIMLVTVTERTREIGLRKAVGARNTDILLQFVTEAMVLALVGGAVGIALSFLMSFAVSALLPVLNVSVQLPSILLATVISGAIGVFFGLYPANRAANLNPIDALRYE